MDASSISSDNYGMEAMQVALAKKAQEADGQMALKLIQDTAQTNPGTLHRSLISRFAGSKARGVRKCSFCFFISFLNQLSFINFCVSLIIFLLSDLWNPGRSFSINPVPITFFVWKKVTPDTQYLRL